MNKILSNLATMAGCARALGLKPIDEDADTDRARMDAQDQDQAASAERKRESAHE
jgi:hypothetical protein